jgi:hypothetical protein
MWVFYIVHKCDIDCWAGHFIVSDETVVGAVTRQLTRCEWMVPGTVDPSD